MAAGTIENILLCALLAAGLGFGFWFTEVLPEMELGAPSKKKKEQKEPGEAGEA